jgi:CheY-like chemotaxis protein
MLGVCGTPFALAAGGLHHFGPHYAANDMRVGIEVSGMLAIESRKPYSILIADDDRGCRESLREIVEPEGYRTLLATSGEEALDIIRAQSVDLILLDMQMPRLTGLETLQIVRQINAVLPCVLVTADATERLMQQALRAHAFSVIAKPVSRNVVLYTVVRALMRAYGGSRGDSHSVEPNRPR